VQPWAYIGDSAQSGVTIGVDSGVGYPVPNGMLKVRSDGLCYAMGIKEPQLAPIITSIPVPSASAISLLGPVTVESWSNLNTGSAPGQYIWRNAGDTGAAGPIRSSVAPFATTTGNSLLFDAGGNPGANPIQWTQFQTYNGQVNTNGTAVSWVNGSQFSGLAATDGIIIGTTLYTIQSVTSNTALVLTSDAGVQNDVAYQAVAEVGTVPLFTPAPGGQGYQNFNCAITGTFYVPQPGLYTLTAYFKDDIIWGIGDSANGTVSLVSYSGGVFESDPNSFQGQTETALNGYPLLPRNPDEFDSGGGFGEDNTFGGSTVVLSFSAAGNYPFEIDWDYWYHLYAVMTVLCSAGNVSAGTGNILPITTQVITEAQYRYTYRSSATGATSNPSPESPEQVLSVLANNLTAIPSTDPQVDKIDFYRLDTGLLNFTYVGTVSNQGVTTITTSAIVAGFFLQKVSVASTTGMQRGQTLIIDTGANQESIVLHDFTSTAIFSVFSKAHATGVPVVGPSPVFSDTLLDTEVAANPLLEFDNYQPFPSIDLPRGGTVDVTAGVATWVSGDQFNVRWLPGTVIIIGTTAFTLNTRPTSTLQLTATNVTVQGGIETVVVPPDGTGLVYEIAQPILAAQPLPYIWGPTDNVAFAFGCGDPLRPGTLYWSKGNNLDAAPDTNQQDITSPSEPLQNGCIVNGLGLVYSTERAFLIVPNFFNALATVQGTVGPTWTIQETISNRGLYIPRALATDGGGNVFFRAKDGIDISVGGQGSKSITDEDLYNLFPHEGNVPQPVTRGGFTVYPPDDTQPEAQKMACADGYLYYDYLDTSGTPRTLVFDIAARGWVWDVYQYPATVHALEEGAGVNGTLTGCVDGSIRPLTNTGAETTCCIVLTKCETAGDVRAAKHWGDIYCEAETVD
jgi:hypothetical protein